MEAPELSQQVWPTLDQKRQQFIFEQVARYFLSPLLSVDQIRPVSVAFYGQRFTTFEALIGGEWLRLVPGDGNAKLGVDFSAGQVAHLSALGVDLAAARAQLSSATTMTIAPMLVAVTPIPADQVVIGPVDVVTHQFFGDHFAFAKHKATVLALLDRYSDWPPVIEAPDLVLTLAGDSRYQVRVKLTQPLAKQLGRYGFRLPTKREQEYLLSDGGDGLFAWGNVANAPTYYWPNRFGLTVKTGSAPELVQEPLTTRAQSTLGQSPFYQQTGRPTAATYRKVAAIAMEAAD